jgi:hypothetical protein
MPGYLTPNMVSIIFLLMVQEGIITKDQCDRMTQRFRQFVPGTPLTAVVVELERELENTTPTGEQHQ